LQRVVVSIDSAFEALYIRDVRIYSMIFYYLDGTFMMVILRSLHLAGVGCSVDILETALSPIRQQPFPDPHGTNNMRIINDNNLIFLLQPVP
jgi:hypothetical protein